jgi:hypothetical protein
MDTLHNYLAGLHDAVIAGYQRIDCLAVSVLGTVSVFALPALSDPTDVIYKAVIFFIAQAYVKRVYFHPLSKFPGPPSAAFSNVDTLSLICVRHKY